MISPSPQSMNSYATNPGRRPMSSAKALVDPADELVHRPALQAIPPHACEHSQPPSSGVPLSRRSRDCPSCHQAQHDDRLCRAGDRGDCPAERHARSFGRRGSGPSSERPDPVRFRRDALGRAVVDRVRDHGPGHARPGAEVEVGPGNHHVAVADVERDDARQPAVCSWTTTRGFGGPSAPGSGSRASRWCPPQASRVATRAP
jgi:hypothetical protein